MRGPGEGSGRWLSAGRDGRRRGRGGPERLLETFQSRQFGQPQHQHLEHEPRILGPPRERLGLDRQGHGSQQVVVRHRARERRQPRTIGLRRVPRRSGPKEQQLPQKSQKLLQNVPGVLAGLGQMPEIGDGCRPVARGDGRENPLDQLRIGQSQDLRAPLLVHGSAGQCCRLVEQRQAVAQASLGRLGQEAHRPGRHGDLLGSGDMLEAGRDLRDRQSPEREPLTPRHDRGGNLVQLRRGQDESRVGRGLLDRLQKRVEGLGRQHVDFVDDRDAESVPLRARSASSRSAPGRSRSCGWRPRRSRGRRETRPDRESRGRRRTPRRASRSGPCRSSGPGRASGPSTSSPPRAAPSAGTRAPCGPRRWHC